jgi:flagellar assembly protein FliH
MTARGECAGAEITAFDYPALSGTPALPAWNGWAEVGDDHNAKTPAHGHGTFHGGGAASAASSEHSADELRRSFEAARERGREEGRQAECEAHAASLAAEEERRKRQLAGLTESFQRERDRYLHAVEHEVVKLAMAVAARILRREAQMDPLLLTGAVRVALGQLAGSCEVRLKVPAAEKDLWTEAIALVPNLSIRPTIVAGDGMRLGDCVIESKVGTVDLGVRSQLGEIERGFFDRSGARERLPAAPPDNALHEVEK